MLSGVVYRPISCFLKLSIPIQQNTEQIKQIPVVFPMHMWQDYSGIIEYKKRLSNKDKADRVIEIERENQTFAFGENY